MVFQAARDTRVVRIARRRLDYMFANGVWGSRNGWILHVIYLPPAAAFSPISFSLRGEFEMFLSSRSAEGMHLTTNVAKTEDLIVFMGGEFTGECHDSMSGPKRHCCL
eukprot:4938965-Amphidinium_carterae.1